MNNSFHDAFVDQFSALEDVTWFLVSSGRYRPRTYSYITDEWSFQRTTIRHIDDLLIYIGGAPQKIYE